MVGKTRLVGQDIKIVIEDLHPLSRVLHRDAALGIADDPMQQR